MPETDALYFETMLTHYATSSFTHYSMEAEGAVRNNSPMDAPHENHEKDETRKTTTTVRVASCSNGILRVCGDGLKRLR